MDAEEFVNKWFLKGKIDNKHEFRTELNQLLVECANTALYAVEHVQLNNTANYLVAINERNKHVYVILKSLIDKVPAHWSVVLPNKGTLSAEYYNPDGALFSHVMRKNKVIRTEAEIKLNS